MISRKNLFRVVPDPAEIYSEGSDKTRKLVIRGLIQSRNLYSGVLYPAKFYLNFLNFSLFIVSFSVTVPVPSHVTVPVPFFRIRISNFEPQEPNFEFEYIREFETEFENDLRYEFNSMRW